MKDEAFMYALEVERDGADFLAKFASITGCYWDGRTYEEAVFGWCWMWDA